MRIILATLILACSFQFAQADTPPADDDNGPVCSLYADGTSTCN